MKRYSLFISASSLVLLVALFIVSPKSFFKAFSVDLSKLPELLKLFQDFVFTNYISLLIILIIVGMILAFFVYGSFHTVAEIRGEQSEE